MKNRTKKKGGKSSNPLWPNKATMGVLAALVAARQVIALATDGQLVVSSNVDAGQGSPPNRQSVDELERRGWITLDGDVLVATELGRKKYHSWDRIHHPSNPITKFIIPGQVPLETADGNPVRRPLHKDGCIGGSQRRSRQVVAVLQAAVRCTRPRTL